MNVNTAISANYPHGAISVSLHPSFSVSLADKPVFGASLTINANLMNKVGSNIPSHFVLGWMNGIGLSNLSCDANDTRFRNISSLLEVEQQLLLTRQPWTLLELNPNMTKTNILFSLRPVLDLV